MPNRQQNSIRALWIVGLLDNGTRYRLIVSRRFPTVEATALDSAPDDETVMTQLNSIRDLPQRCEVMINESTMLIGSSSETVSVLILPSISDNEIAIGTAALLSDMLCRWLSPYIGRLEESQLWPISVPLALTLFKTMPFGEYRDDPPLDQVYNELARGMDLPEMGPCLNQVEEIRIQETTICWFEHDLMPRGLRQIGEIWYYGCPSTKLRSQMHISLAQNASIQHLRLHEKAILKDTFNEHVITFSPINRMPMLIAKYEWINPAIPIMAYRFSIEDLDDTNPRLEAKLEVKFSMFVQNVEIAFELEGAAIENPDVKMRIRRINDKTNEFIWPCGNVITNGCVKKEIRWSAKEGHRLQRDAFIEIRCMTDSSVKQTDQICTSLTASNIYRIKIRNTDHDVKSHS